MTKKVSEVSVEINELAVSLLGWEVQDFRARVTSEQYKKGGEYFHKLTVSGVLNFNEDDWIDCFTDSKKRPGPLVMLLRSPKLSSQPAITSFYVGQHKRGRPLRIAENGWFINSYNPIDHSDLRIELTSFDSVTADGDITDIPLDARTIPIEIDKDDSTPSSVQLTFDQIEAFSHRRDGDRENTRIGQIRASGRVTFGTAENLLADWVSTWRHPINKTPTVTEKAPFKRQAPNVYFDVLDDTGFLLEQLHGSIDIDINVDDSGRVPTRVPRWLIDLRFNPDDYSAPPSRVIARIEGN